MEHLRISDEVASRLRAGVAWFRGLDASEENPHWHEMEALADTYRQRWEGKAPSEIPELEAARRLFRSFGVDPTRTRPSSEALLRRVLKGQDLYRINRVVDAGNWASLCLLLPIGLYDMDRLEGNVTVRQGRAGESYEGIRKGAVNVEGRLMLADDAGPFGAPTSDSLRTSVCPETTRVLAVVFAPAGFPSLELEEGMVRLVKQFLRWCGGEEEGMRILGEGQP
jgi:DNA/RNA-binding domain of Phe-tRNA-synthetase-like protein